MSIDGFVTKVAADAGAAEPSAGRSTLERLSDAGCESAGAVAATVAAGSRTSPVARRDDAEAARRAFGADGSERRRAAGVARFASAAISARCVDGVASAAADAAATPASVIAGAIALATGASSTTDAGLRCADSCVSPAGVTLSALGAPSSLRAAVSATRVAATSDAATSSSRRVLACAAGASTSRFAAASFARASAAGIGSVVFATVSSGATPSLKCTAVVCASAITPSRSSSCTAAIVGAIASPAPATVATVATVETAASASNPSSVACRALSPSESPPRSCADALTRASSSRLDGPEADTSSCGASTGSPNRSSVRSSRAASPAAARSGCAAAAVTPRAAAAERSRARVEERSERERERGVVTDSVMAIG
nr:hypothetical protein [Burkholderia multivorans]